MDKDTKFKKSDYCVICGEKIIQSIRDGKFLCNDCLTVYQKRIFDLLKTSKYKDKICNVNGYTCSNYGTSNKNTIIKISINRNFIGHVYVKIPTYKIFELIELQNDKILLEYLVAEIDVQYITQIKKYKEKELKKFEHLLNDDFFIKKCKENNKTVEECYENIKESILAKYED